MKQDDIVIKVTEVQIMLSDCRDVLPSERIAIKVSVRPFKRAML